MERVGCDGVGAVRNLICHSVSPVLIIADTLFSLGALIFEVGFLRVVCSSSEFNCVSTGSFSFRYETY